MVGVCINGAAGAALLLFKSCIAVGAQGNTFAGVRGGVRAQSVDVWGGGGGCGGGESVAREVGQSGSGAAALGREE